MGNGYKLALAAVVVIIILIAVAPARPAADGFCPVGILPCGPGAPPEYAVDPTGRGAEGTVVWEPYNPVTKISLQRGIEAPAVAVADNAVTGIFRLNRVKKYGDKYNAGGYGACRADIAPVCGATPREGFCGAAHAEAGGLATLEGFSELGAFAGNEKELGAFASAETFDAGDESFDGSAALRAAVSSAEHFEPGRRVSGSRLLSRLTRVSPPASTSGATVGVSSIAGSVDVEGPFGGWINGAELDSDRRGATPEQVATESFVSQRRTVANPLTAIGVGLGSIHQDPRFEPGPQKRGLAGDTSPAPGSHAGAPTLGALASSEFRPPPTFRSGYSYALDGSVFRNRAQRVATLSQ